MDVVYVVGERSKWGDDNDLLRYSIRSLYDSGIDFDRIFIVGHRPAWMKNIVHIPIKDVKGTAISMTNKILAACTDERISDDFILCADDYFFLNNDVKWDQVPTWGDYTHKKISARTQFGVALRNSMDRLKRIGVRPMNFESHCPMVINKKRYLDVNKENPLPASGGYVPRSIYFSIKAPEDTIIANEKVFYLNGIVGKHLNGKIPFTGPFMTITTSTVTDDQKRFIRSRFSTVSECELYSPNENMIFKRDMTQPVIFGIASTPLREDTLELTLRSILSQADEVRVYLNNYETVPAYLKHPTAFIRKKDFDKIRIFRSQEYGDLGSLGKHFIQPNEELKGYRFTIDDDILYPPDYVDRMISEIERYGRKAVVGVHAAQLRLPIKTYYTSLNTSQTRFEKALSENKHVHVLGSGTMAYHTDTVNIDQNFFEAKNYDDPQISAHLQKQGISRVAIARRYKWLVNIDRAYATSIHRNRSIVDEAATRIVNAVDWESTV